MVPQYGELPYEYVLNAITRTSNLRRKELHELEVPISVLALQQAEMNRDRKKNKKPFTLSDFFCYDLSDEVDSVDARYGRAAIRLIEMRQFPSWALFVYKDLIKNAHQGRDPDILCYQCENAIVLAPSITDTRCNGMLIALESASSRILTLYTIDKTEAVRLRMPRLDGKTVAIENCYMDLA